MFDEVDRFNHTTQQLNNSFFGNNEKSSHCKKESQKSNVLDLDDKKHRHTYPKKTDQNLMLTHDFNGNMYLIIITVRFKSGAS